MADSSDVETALLQAIEAVRVSLDATWSIYRGSPEAAALDVELAAGDVHVTVNARTGFWRNTTSYPNREIELPRAAATLTVSLAGQVATFAGTCGTDEIAGVQVGNTAWVVRCSTGDTPDTVAATLATASGGTASGAALTLANILAARTGRDGATLREVRRQEQQFTIRVRCADPEVRDAVSAAIDAVLADTTFLTLVDGSAGRITGAGADTNDRAQSASLYARDINVLVDYPTTIRMPRTPVLFQGTRAATGAGGATIIFGAVAP